MPNRVRIGVPQRVGRQRRKTTWIASADVASTTTLLAGAAVLDQALSGAQISALGPATVVRTRGIIDVGTDQAAGTEHPFGAFGVAVVSEQARAAGVASIPTPITDEGSDLWFVHQFFFAGFFFLSSVGAGQDHVQYSFDSKGQRKLEGDDSQAIVFAVENASTVGLIYTLKFRMLLMLT